MMESLLLSAVVPVVSLVVILVLAVYFFIKKSQVSALALLFVMGAVSLFMFLVKAIPLVLFLVIIGLILIPLWRLKP